MASNYKFRSELVSGGRTIGRSDDAATAVPGKSTLTEALDAAPPSAVPNAVVSALSSSDGEPLADPDRWSRRVGADVRHARIVSGAGAAAAAASLGTRAFTVGHRVFLGAGNDETTDEGGLLAHELTHVAQQRGAPPPASWHQLRILDHGDSRELAARAHHGAGGGTSEQVIAKDGGPGAPAKPASSNQHSTGVVISEDGANVHSTPEAVDTNLVGFLAKDTTCTVLNVDADGWATVAAHMVAAGPSPKSVIGNGLVQAYRLRLFAGDDAGVRLVTIPSGTTAFDLCAQYYGTATTQHAQDARYFSNVLYYVNENADFVSRANGATPSGGFYTQGGMFPNGQIMTIGGQRVWIPSLAFALTLKRVVGTGSYSGNVEAFLDRFQKGLPFLKESLAQAPSNFGRVAGKELELIEQHMGEIVGTMLVFAGAEMLSAALAGTGVGALGALAINLLLTLFGLYGVVQASAACLQQAAQWITLAIDSDGDPGAITAASQMFCAMLLTLALAILAAIGTSKQAGKTLEIANKLGTVDAATVASGAVAEAATDGSKQGPLAALRAGIRWLLRGRQGELDIVEIGENVRARFLAKAEAFKVFKTNAAGFQYFYNFKSGVIFLDGAEGGSEPYLFIHFAKQAGFQWEGGARVAFDKLVPILEEVKGVICCDPAGARVWLHDAGVDAGMELSKLEALTSKVLGYWPSRTTVAVLPSTYEVYVGPSIDGLDNTLPP